MSNRSVLGPLLSQLGSINCSPWVMILPPSSLEKELDEASRSAWGQPLSWGSWGNTCHCCHWLKPSVPHCLPWWLRLWECSLQKRLSQSPREPDSQSFRKLGWNGRNKSLSKDWTGQEVPTAWKSICVFQRLAEQRPTHGYFGKNRKV